MNGYKVTEKWHNTVAYFNDFNVLKHWNAQIRNVAPRISETSKGRQELYALNLVNESVTFKKAFDPYLSC